MQETVFFRIMNENEGGELGSYVKAFFWVLSAVSSIIYFGFWVCRFCGAVRVGFSSSSQPSN